MFPLNEARKLNAFFMMRWARRSVSGLVVGGLDRESISDVEGEELEGVVVEEEDRRAICADTESLLSRDIPMVISPIPMFEDEDGEVSASISISGAAFCVLELELEISRFILNIALSFPGPIPPRNLNGGASPDEEEGELDEGGSDM
ncbi:hypothetical protein NHQ30_002194 [Ciborinia camelliae]|nr:hypothetical protein NHQ30_002194 [Ciborinia camelliae]